MGEARDWPFNEWERNQARMDREDIAAGREPNTEAAYYERQERIRREAIAKSRRKRDLWTHHEDIHPIDPSEVRY